MANYLKLQEVAHRLGISERTARRYVTRGEMPSVYVGGSYRVSEDDLAEYLRQAEVKPGPKTEAPNASASAGLHDAGLVPIRDLEHAAELMRSATEIAAALPAEWNAEVEEYARAGRDLPKFRTLEMQCTSIRLGQIFAAAFAFIQHDAAQHGYSPDPATWSAGMQEDLIWNIATLDVLSELTQRWWEGDKSVQDARAVRAEFGPLPEEARGWIDKAPTYQDALSRKRAMAGVT